MAKLCMGCMNPLPQGSETCAVCGYDPAKDKNPDNCLPAASVLQGHYIVGKCLKEYSDHLLYLAYDRQLKEPCFIQEFFPGSVSRRDTIGGVQPLAGCERVFAEYADRYRGTMRALARLRELPAIIPVYDIFDENGTVYAASDYCEGMTLSRKIKLAGGRLPWSEARPLFMSLLTSLTRLNEAGICHLGICPDNILIGSDGKPRLRSFSIAAARRAGSDLTPELITGYAAPEQYGMEGEISAAADVYGVAATIFRTVTGNEPPAGNSRAKNSDDLFMPAEVAEELTQQVCIALFNALQVSPDNRTATVAELRDQLSMEPNVSALVNEAKADRGEVVEPEEKKEPKKGRTLLIVFGCCLAVLLIVVGLLLWMLWSQGGEKEPEESTNIPLPSFVTSTTLDPNKENQVSTDNLVGQNYYTIRDKKLGGELTVKLAYVMYSDKAAGTILSQSPEAGSVVNKGTEILVTISNGQKTEELAIPDVSGWEEAHAKLYLEALGFTVNSVQLQLSNYEKGKVDSTDPAIGTVKKVGDEITLRVSNVEPPEPEESSDPENPDDGWTSIPGLNDGEENSDDTSNGEENSGGNGWWPW
ncbi:MAG: PASTA domain-containing protein [Clostridia bacterium]|nr:PASTA domain-containing protein [Clostridia bacterium]